MRSGPSFPATGRALVRAAEERERRLREDLQVEPRRAVLDVPDVQLDPLRPGKRRTAAYLRPAGDARLHVEPPCLPRRVALDLIAQRRARPDDAHLATDHVPELWELVERKPAENPARTRDARVALVHRHAGAHRLRS